MKVSTPEERLNARREKGFKIMAAAGHAEDENSCVYNDFHECHNNFRCASCPMRESDND